MEELEKNLDNLDILFKEGQSQKDLNNEIINFKSAKSEIENKDKKVIALKPQNKLGTILNPFLKNIKKEEPTPPTKNEAENIVKNADEVIEKRKKSTDDNKLMNIPTQLLPVIKQEEIYPLTVQKETSKALVLTKKVGSVFTSILVTIVVLTVGVVLALVLRG